MNETSIPVLIVGGGPVGLSTAVGLSRAGLASLLVERHPGTAIHPKARGVDVRTMEVFRRWQIDEAVRAAGLPPEEHGFFFRGSTLTSVDFERIGGGGQADAARRLSPQTWMVISQDVLEPILLERVREFGRTHVRFAHELVDFELDDSGIRATVVDRRTGRSEQIEAAYLVGADGSASRVRETLGVELVGHGPLVWNSSILFRADLGPLIHDRHSAVYYLVGGGQPRPRGYPLSVGNPPENGALLTINGRDRWLLVIGREPTPDGSPAPLETEQCLELIRQAIGRADLDVEVLSVVPWTPAARVAERYRVGRAFLAGDAAHEMTPSGAFGLNVGIQDADNLAWKLAAVGAGWAGPALLGTYDVERRPAGRFATDESYLQFSGQKAPRPFGNWGVILGATYASDAIEPDGSPAPELVDPAVDYVPLARPGHRAPHTWLGSGDRRRSTLDLLGNGFTLLGRDPSWAAAVELLASRLGMPLAAQCLVGGLEPADPAEFERLYGIGQSGAVLVRPDGYVAWREQGDDVPGDSRATRLEATMRRILDRPDLRDRSARTGRFPDLARRR